MAVNRMILGCLMSLNFSAVFAQTDSDCPSREKRFFDELPEEMFTDGRSFKTLFAEKAKEVNFPEDKFALAKDVSFEFVEIPAGTFRMGSHECSNCEPGRDNDEKQRKVVITKAFEMGRTEVTQLQWYLVMERLSSGFSSESFSNGDHVHLNDPVPLGLNMNLPMNVDYFDEVNQFIARLNKLDPKYHYRLPTEAEWEYASRAGANSTYSFGNSSSELSKYAHHRSNSDFQPQSVASLLPNSYGLYDMYGNLWEWCSDWYTEAPQGRIDPVGLPKPRLDSAGRILRVLKGGSFMGWPTDLRSANREPASEWFKTNDRGFRLVRTLK